MKAYVISLQDASGKTRLAALKHRVSHMNGLDLVLEPAVKGSAIDPRGVGHMTTLSCGLTCTPAIVGIARSHMNVWKKVRDGPDDMAIVFEDDVVPVDDFNSAVEDAIQEAGHFHVLNLGCFLCDFRRRRDPVGVRDVSFFAGAHAYVITKEGAELLLRHYDNKIVTHIDTMMSMAVMYGLRVKATNRLLATQDGHETSSNSTTNAFPAIIDDLLRRVEAIPGIDLSFYVNTNHARLGTWDRHVSIDTGMILAFVLGVLVRRVSIPPILAILTIDAVYIRGVPSDTYIYSMIKRLLMYILGVIIASYIV